MRVSSFAPIEAPDARVLLLGSMPGAASLARGQYYAHPQNAFWRVLGAVLGFDPAAPYEQRVDALRQGGIALWDVLESCVRPGSLDADIDASSAQPNDIGALLRRQPAIALIVFNGATAERYFGQRVLPRLGNGSAIPRVRLPSTSPAHAGMPLARKIELWRGALEGAVQTGLSR